MYMSLFLFYYQFSGLVEEAALKSATQHAMSWSLFSLSCFCPAPMHEKYGAAFFLFFFRDFHSCKERTYRCKYAFKLYGKSVINWFLIKGLMAILHSETCLEWIFITTKYSYKIPNKIKWRIKSETWFL